MERSPKVPPHLLTAHPFTIPLPHYPRCTLRVYYSDVFIIFQYRLLIFMKRLLAPDSRVRVVKSGDDGAFYEPVLHLRQQFIHSLLVMLQRIHDTRCQNISLCSITIHTYRPLYTDSVLHEILHRKNIDTQAISESLLPYM